MNLLIGNREGGKKELDYRILLVIGMAIILLAAACVIAASVLILGFSFFFM